MSDASVESLVHQLAWLLLGAAVIGMLARELRMPYAVALVIGGLLVEQTHLFVVPRLDPTVLLFVFLPPLLFDAAFRFDRSALPAVLGSIVVLALPGTLATAGLVALALVVALHLPPGVALLFGSIVAATDPVAVVGVFRSLRVSAHLGAIAEGESMLNDGVALTLFTVFLQLAGGNPADIGQSVSLFGRQVVGGLAIGALLGLLFSRVTTLAHDHLVEMTLSTALAYGSYLVALSVDTSGPLACVAAGLVHGSGGRRLGMSETTRGLLDDLWEYLGFLANSVVFLLVGLTVNLRALADQAWPVAVAVVAVVLARSLVLGGLTVIVPRERLATSPRERVVLVWGGLRGALTMALALALPAETPARDLVEVMAFGVVLFTLVGQGLTLGPLIRRLGLAPARAAATTGD